MSHARSITTHILFTMDYKWSSISRTLKIQPLEKSRPVLAGCMCKMVKNQSLDVNNQNIEQAYMGKVSILKWKHAVCKNTYKPNDRAKYYSLHNVL